MIELLSLVVTIGAVTGVVLNNRRQRACFLIWLGSNGLSCLIHVVSGLPTLALRDAIFIVLAVEGWRLWGKER